MNDNYGTNDMGLAAGLIAYGFKLLELQKDNLSGKAKFVFDVSYQDAELKESIKNYWDNTLMVSANAYFNAQKNLKSRIHSN